VRVWLPGHIFVGVLGLLVRHLHGLRVLAQWLVTVIGAGSLERSLISPGTERGTIEGSCAFLTAV